MATTSKPQTAVEKVAQEKVLKRKYAKTVLKLIRKHGFKSYHQTTRELEKAEKRTGICAYQIRGVIIALNEAKLIDIVLPTREKKEATEPKVEVVTAKEAKAKFGVVNLRERHDKLMAQEGYEKVKSDKFPFDVTYVRTVK